METYGRMTDWMLMVLIVTSRCTAACKHCCFGCTPKGDNLSGDATMTLDQMKSIIDQACKATRRGVAGIGFSGGEPFLLRDDLVSIVRYAKEKGIPRLTVNSACYWATSRKAALWRLEPLVEAGMQKLDISTDDFHTEFIKLENIRIAVEVALELGLEVDVNSVVTKKTRSQAEIWDALGLGKQVAEQVTTHEWRCEPVGATPDFIPLDDLIMSPGLPTGGCPAPNFAIRPDGDVYFCCSSAGWTPSLKLGNAFEEPISVLWKRYKNRELHRVMLTEGPSGFLPAFERDGVDHKLHGHYVDVCHLCHHITSDQELVQSVNKEVARREVARVQKLAESLFMKTQSVSIS